MGTFHEVLPDNFFFLKILYCKMEIQCLNHTTTLYTKITYVSQIAGAAATEPQNPLLIKL